jgi:hypothetical protein
VSQKAVTFSSLSTILGKQSVRTVLKMNDRKIAACQLFVIDGKLLVTFYIQTAVLSDRKKNLCSSCR